MVPPGIPDVMSYCGNPEWSIEGRDADGTVLFTLPFAMPPVADAEEGAGGFAFTLPVRPGWEALALTFPDVDELDSRTGINVGASATFPLSESVGVRIGGAYVQKGAHGGDADFEVTLSLDYIEFSSLLKANFPFRNTSASMYVLAGPSVAFEANCESSFSDGVSTTTINCTELRFDTNTIDFGATGGAGFEFAIPMGMILSLEVLYTRGFTSAADEWDDDDVKNRAFTVWGGFAFPVG